MIDRNRLDLHHELLLLALKNEEGTAAFGTMYHQGLAGGLVAELLLRERIAIREERKKKFVELRDGSPLGEPALDGALERIARAKRRATLQSWIMRLATQKLKHLVAAELCRRGILRADEDKVLLIFTRKIYPELDPRPEREIVERLRRAVESDAADVDPRTVILVSIGQAAGLLESVFPKQKLRERKKRIARIVNGEATGQATREAIRAVQAAVMMASIMPAILATTVTTH